MKTGTKNRKMRQNESEEERNGSGERQKGTYIERERWRLAVLDDRRTYTR